MGGPGIARDRSGWAEAQTSAVTATLGLAVAAWVISVGQMRGMDMGVATPLGSFASFVGLWVAMMAAMMLPGTVPAILRRVHTGPPLRIVPAFVGSYLAVWTVVGLAAYLVYRPHGTTAAGAVVIAAGVYELTPVKRYFRRRGRESAGPGFEFGLCCVGSSLGLMIMLLALGVMSTTWMVVIAVLILAQKLVPPRAAVDVSVALLIVLLGIVIIIEPSTIPGLTPSM